METLNHLVEPKEHVRIRLRSSPDFYGHRDTSQIVHDAATVMPFCQRMSLFHPTQSSLNQPLKSGLGQNSSLGVL
jgi:hypothetical protein